MSSFRCQPSAGDTISPAYNIWSSGLFCSRSDILELTAQTPAWPVTYWCCFWTTTKNISQSTSVHSASEALVTMRYINWYFTYLLTKVHQILQQVLQTVSKSIHNWRHYPSSKCYEIDKTCDSEFGALLWRHLTPERKTTIWLHNYSLWGAQQPLRYFGKFTVCVTFGAHKLVTSEPFLEYLYDYELWQYYQLCIVMCGKKFYIGNGVLGPKLLRWNFLQISQVSIRSGEHKLFSQ